MANANRATDSEDWILAWRPLNGAPGSKRHRRAKSSDLPENTKAAATALAQECDRYCRICEGAPDPDEIKHALKLKAITEDQAHALLYKSGDIPSHLKPKEPKTLREAAMMHPSSPRETLDQQLRHLRYLDRFAAFSGAKTPADVTLQDVMRWVAELRRAGMAWDSRRHALLYVRRACQMGATLGLPDPLARMRLDQRDRLRAKVEAWSFEQWCDGLVRLQRRDDKRAYVAALLGGGMGLGPSEIFRLQCRDADDDLLDVGVREAKNTFRQRLLPMPAIIAAAVADLKKGRKATEPLLMTASNRRQQAFNEKSFTHWLGPILTEVTGRKLPPKTLRKTFSNWVLTRGGKEGISESDMEAFLGHAPRKVSEVSRRHYVHGLLAEELRPAALIINQRLELGLRVAVTKLQAESDKGSAKPS